MDRDQDPHRDRGQDDQDQVDGCGGYCVDLSSRCVSTQTEESPISTRAHQLCRTIILELALEESPAESLRDNVFESMCCHIAEMLEKHSILFNGMVRRFEVSDYRVFASIADELFETSIDPPTFNATWGRILSLFAFAVRLAQMYKETEDMEMIDNIINYLSHYVSNHLLEFVENNGGWDGLVIHFPLPNTEDRQTKTAILISGLCVGLVASLYVGSFLSR